MDRMRSREGDAPSVTIPTAEDDDLEETMHQMARDSSAGQSIAQLRTRLYSRLNAGDTAAKVKAIELTALLVPQLENENSPVVVPVIANVLRSALAGDEPPVLQAAAALLGQLAAKRGFLIISETVSFELKRALEWLTDDYEFRRLSSVLVLQELSAAIPAAVFQQMDRYFDAMWPTLRDPHPLIHSAAALTLRRMLGIVLKRGPLRAPTLFSSILADSLVGLARVGPMTHGSLLAVGEVFGVEPPPTGELLSFLVEKFPFFCDAVLKLRSAKDKEKIIVRTVMRLLPRLARFQPAVFSTHLKPVVKHLLGLIGKPGPQTDLSLDTLGQIAVAVGSREIQPYLVQLLPVITPLVRVEAKSGRSSLPYPAALLCVGKLAEAAGDELSPLLENGLLQRLFDVGLFAEVVEAATSIHRSCPQLAALVESLLLDLLSLVLTDAPFRPIGVPALVQGSEEPSFAKRARQQTAERGPALKIVALSTLRSFPFSCPLVHMAEKLIRYLDSKLPALKLEAISASLHLLNSDRALIPKLATSISLRVVSRVLLLGTTDPDASIRAVCVRRLAESPLFDTYVNHPDNMKLLLLLAYDDSLDIRITAIQLLGRLETWSPGFVRPALRKMLVQLLQDFQLEMASAGELANAARLMAAFVHAAPAELVRPYVPVLFRSVSQKLTHSDSRIATAMLTVVGELAVSSGPSVASHMEATLPLLVQMAQRQVPTAARREVVYRTLGQLCQGGGFVSDPFVQYPSMLTTLLHEIRTDPDPAVREEVLRLFGIVGALDPQLYHDKRQESSKKEAKADFSEVSFTSNKVSPDVYSRVAIMALKEILASAQSPILQKTVVQALVTIFRSLGPRKTITYLRDVMPLLLALLRASDTSVHDFVLQELGAFVLQTGLHMGPYVEDIFALLFPMWGSANFAMAIGLIQQIARAFGDEFARYMPLVFPRLLMVLKDADAPTAHRLAVLALLPDIKFCLLQYSYFLVPVVVVLFSSPGLDRPAIQCLEGLYAFLDMAPFVPTAVRALLRCMDGSLELQSAALSALTSLCERMGADFAPMVPFVDDQLRLLGLNAPEYHKMVAQSVTRTRSEPRVSSRTAAALALPTLNTSTDAGGAPLTPAQQQQLQAPDHDEDGAANAGGGDMGADGDDMSPSASGTYDNEPVAASSNSVDSASRVALRVNVRNLANVWKTDQVSTQQDWFEWLRRFVVTLLVESPSPAFRACLSVAQVHYPLARQLFNVAFASVWRDLNQQGRQLMADGLQAALKAATIPPEILQTLLDLVEYMEIEDGLPIDKLTLENLARKSAAYAKALRYAEDNYRLNPEGNVERMIQLYSQVRLPDAALGVLTHARARFQIELDESWMERLQRWEQALALHEEKLRTEPESVPAKMGRLRCLKSLGEWNVLLAAADQEWERAKDARDVQTMSAVAPYAAAAAHNTREWALMEKYLDRIPFSDEDGNFYRAICAVSRQQWSAAQSFIDAAREQADVEMTALAAESYMRAYSAAIRLQQLVELEEIMSVRTLECSPQVPLRTVQSMRESISLRWNKRFASMGRQPDFMRRVLGVRALLFAPGEQVNSWLLYASVCARTDRVHSNRRAITQLLGTPDWESPGGFDVVAALEPDGENSRALVGALKFLWRNGKRSEALASLELLLHRLATRKSGHKDAGLSKMYIRLASWQRSMKAGAAPDEMTLQRVVQSCLMATHFDTTYKASHLWALTNFELIQYYERFGSEKVRPFLLPALQGFFDAILLSASRTLCFPDVLRIMTLWFRHAALSEVEEALREGFRRVPIDTWIVVIPQLIARMHSPQSVVRRLVHELLVQLAAVHPQALVFPLAVASKSTTTARRTAALAVLARMRLHSPVLVEQALMVGAELIGASVVLHEQWLEALEDAAGFFYTSENIPGFLKRLAPLHADLASCKFETRHQVAFQTDYGSDLNEAAGHCDNYRVSRDVADLNEAWEAYARVYYKLKKRIPKLRKLTLQHISPSLYNARDLELAVPGTYAPNQPVVRIASFANQMRVYSTKQRPRKLNIVGSDGISYSFVLKAHEDLRQDERVMQFFSLANSLLAKRLETKGFEIETYPIVPLSPNSGLIGFVPHSDTLHQLITDYRMSAGIPLDIEFQMLYQHVEKSWNNYHILTMLQKVHVFRHICNKTSGQELAKVMWIRAGSSERWLENRTTFTNSFAVMSIVGYILGLGDRHPNNIVIDRTTGKLIHIDFGDCFETSIDRKKFPETVPFRCTRMLINCLDVAGVDGTYRVVCERVMEVLRLNRDSLMAVLEAFVYDPLFSWRLIAGSPSQAKGGVNDVGDTKDKGGHKRASATSSAAALYQGISPASPLSSDSYSSDHEDHSESAALGSREPSTNATTLGSPGDDSGISGTGGGAQVPNNRAVQVIDRIQKKLTGQDFRSGDEQLDHKAQVARLIEEATSETNLAVLFHGWCSFW